MSPMLASILEQMESQPGCLGGAVISSGASMAISRIRLLEGALVKITNGNPTCDTPEAQLIDNQIIAYAALNGDD